MRMFDYVRSSYNFGEEFTNSTVFQTKGIDDFSGGSLLTYWIDPSGVIWEPDYVGTNDFVIIEEGDPEYNDKLLFLNHKWVPTGKRGRIHPLNITKYVEIYPESRCHKTGRWPTIKIHFKHGVLQDYEIIYHNY